MSISTQSLAPHYTCKFCRRTFSLDGPVIIGEKPHEKLARLGQQLMMHVGNDHRNEAAQIEMAGREFSGWLMFAQFNHNDTAIHEMQELVRQRIRQTTKAQSIPDDEIEAQIAFAFPPESTITLPQRKTIIGLLKAMRNTLEEIQPQAK